jgi:hypothetical protein
LCVKNLLDKANDLLYDNYRCEGIRLIGRPIDLYNASALRISLDASSSGEYCAGVAEWQTRRI